MTIIVTVILSFALVSYLLYSVQCSQFFRPSHFCKKTGALLAKVRASDGQKYGQNSTFARLSLRLATLLRVVELPKQLNNALSVQ